MTHPDDTARRAEGQLPKHVMDYLRQDMRDNPPRYSPGVRLLIARNRRQMRRDRAVAAARAARLPVALLLAALAAVIAIPGQ